MRRMLDNVTVFRDSTGIVYAKGIETNFYFRLAVFIKDKGVLIPAQLFNTENGLNNIALTLMNAMLDRTSGGYWMRQLAKYNAGEPCNAIETATASEDEKNTLRVMVMLMRQDNANDGKTDGFVAEYLKHEPASQMDDEQLEPLFDKCFLTIM